MSRIRSALPFSSAPERVDAVLDVGVGALAADGACGRLDVLRGDGGVDLGDRDAEAVHAHRVEPDAHRVDVAHRRHGADAVDACERVGDVLRDVVVELHRAHVRAVRHEREEAEHVGRALVHLDALARHLLGELRLGALDGVLDVDLRDVGVGAGLEVDLGEEVAVVLGVGRVVDHVVHAVDLRLDGGADRVEDGLRRRAGIVAHHVDLRRRDVGVLLDGELGHADYARQHQNDAADEGQTRAVDENLAKHGSVPLS